MIRILFIETAIVLFIWVITIEREGKKKSRKKLYILIRSMKIHKSYRSILNISNLYVFQLSLVEQVASKRL